MNKSHLYLRIYDANHAILATHRFATVFDLEGKWDSLRDAYPTARYFRHMRLTIFNGGRLDEKVNSRSRAA